MNEKYLLVVPPMKLTSGAHRNRKEDSLPCIFHEDYRHSVLSFKGIDVSRARVPFDNAVGLSSTTLLTKSHVSFLLPFRNLIVRYRCYFLDNHHGSSSRSHCSQAALPDPVRCGWSSSGCQNPPLCRRRPLYPQGHALHVNIRVLTSLLSPTP